MRQPNRNTLIGPTTGVDGLKTGHTKEAGYGLETELAEPDGALEAQAVLERTKVIHFDAPAHPAAA